jgi:type II secretory pathway component GspD/PulD (secretin)
MSLKLRPTGKFAAAAILAAAFALTSFTAGANAQTGAPDARPAPPPAPETVQTFFIKNASEPNDLNDIQTDLRNIIPRARIYGIQSQSAITIKAVSEDMETARKLIADLDRPKQLYRLTYAITEIDGGNRLGARHFVVLAASGERTIFKQGSRVPIVTGTNDGQTVKTQVQYVDTGLNIEATVGGSPEGLSLRTKIEQSSVADEKAVAGSQDPVITQLVVQETSVLAQGKPLVLGSFDIPGTSKHQEIEVVAELVH